MKHVLHIILYIGIPFFTICQTVDYYQSCFGLSGEELKSELHELISDHTSYSYTTTKDILRESDEDPNNPSNIILVYSGNSIDKFDFASNMSLILDRNILLKIHGEFDNGDRFIPAYSDAHNLKPVDSMNTFRGEKILTMAEV